MGKYVIDEATLTGIGDAIREKEGTTGAIPVNDMKNRIQAIDTQEDLDAEIAAQDDLIAQIDEKMKGKAAGGGGSAVEKVCISIPYGAVVARYYDGNGFKEEDLPSGGSFYPVKNSLFAVTLGYEDFEAQPNDWVTEGGAVWLGISLLHNLFYAKADGVVYSGGGLEI